MNATDASAKTKALDQWRSRDYDGARETLRQALLGEIRTDVVLDLTNNLAGVERGCRRLYEALALQCQAGCFAHESQNHTLIGNHYHGLGITFEMVAEDTCDKRYFERALTAYEVAAYRYELAEEAGRFAATLNNIAYLLIQMDRAGEAFPYLDKASALITDKERLAQIELTRAQAYLKLGRHDEAVLSADDAVRALRSCGNLQALSEARDTLALANSMRVELSAELR
jgi:tetratricopeptide (TPR) repeat protein